MNTPRPHRAFAFTALAIFALATSSAIAATASSSLTPPVIDGEDISNYSDVSGTDKWWAAAPDNSNTKGQSFTTGNSAVRIKAITYQIEGTSATATKTYLIRLGKVTGSVFTQIHSETAVQNAPWNSNEAMTWTFDTPVLLEPFTTYGIDVTMVSSTTDWGTGIPYITVTGDDYSGGLNYSSTTYASGTTNITNAIASDRIFHLDIERPLGPVFALVATSPLDNATGALANRELVLTFSQNVTPGIGSLIIRNLTDDTEVSLPASDPRLTYDQNVVRIAPAGLLAWGTSYAIRIEADAILGEGGALIDAISDDTTWNFTTLAGDPLLVAIAALKTHITGSAPLTGPQIAAHKTTIDNERQRFGENPETISAVKDLITTYDSAKGPLFVSGSTVTDFSRNNTNPADKKSVSPENIHWVVYNVMQHAMDVIYTAPVLAEHEALLNNYKFGSHTNFPGPCPAPADPPVGHTVPINGSFPVTFGRNTQQWTLPARKPTGTYLAPGTIATVTVPSELVDAGYKVRVGAHSWDLSYRPPVKRLERATRLYPIDATTIKVASPYGGGIYIEVPIGANAGVVNVTVTGAVRAPYFSAKPFHSTTPEQWNNERTHPAPWADFQSEKFMTQVPRTWIYNHPDPAKMMADWDKAMDAINLLMGFDTDRGKETMYCQTDVILRSSVHAPGYPAVNVSSSATAEVSPLGYAGNYLVRGPNVSLTAANIEFHEQGHAYGFPKFGGESESNVNLLQPAMLNRKFGRTFDEAQNGSFGGGNSFITIDNTAVAWMCVFNFSPREVPMADGEKAYQHKGHAKFMDIARLFGWEKLDAYWRSFMQDDAGGISYGSGTDDKLLRLSRHVGKDIRPLFHFWGIHPQNPTALAAALAAENLTPSIEIRNQLLHYKTLVPADNATFRTFATAWRGRKPTINGAWEEREHARQWDTEALYGAGDQQRSQATNPGEIYNENSANDIRNRVQELVDLYFPSGIKPVDMTFAIAPSAVNATTIGMVATTATAIDPVEYYFDETSGNPGANDSDWQTSPYYEDTGLSAGYTYRYRVMARISTDFESETAWSATAEAPLTAGGDVTKPTPTPMSFATPPYAVDENTITMTAKSASDINGVEYYFDNTDGGGIDSGWQDSPVYTNTGLLPETEYTYVVRARDKSPNAVTNVTADSAPATANTADIPDVTPPQIVSLSPANGTDVTDLATNLVITFDEPVAAGGGFITLKNLSDGTQSQISVNSAAVSVTGSVMTINPASDLLFGKTYAIQIAAGAVADASNNPSNGINDNTTWSFDAILADPIAVPGGPYNITIGNSLSLDGSSSLPSDGQTIDLYQWDLDNDGDFDEAITGATPPAISEAALRGLYGMADGANTIQLRVTDSAAKTSTVQTTVNFLQLFTFDGANKTNGDNWNAAGNWNPDAVPAGFAEVAIPAGKQVTANSASTLSYSGNLTIGAGAFLQAGYGANSINSHNALGTAGSSIIYMGAGSRIAFRDNFAPQIPAIVLQGNVEITLGSSTALGTDPVFAHPITGAHTLTLNGKSDASATFNAANSFAKLVATALYGTSYPIIANVAGSLGAGDVTIESSPSGIISANLFIGAADAIADSATLTLNGPASATKLKISASDTIARLVVDGVRQPAGTYGKIGSGAQYEVSWINSTSTTDFLTVIGSPSTFWDIDGTLAGAGGIAPAGIWDLDATANWNSAADGNGAAAFWSASTGQTAVFAAGSDATGSYTVTVSGTQDIGGLEIKQGDVTLSGDGLQMTSDSLLNVASGSTATVGNVISIDSSRKLSKSGDGTLVLSGANTYAGGTRLEAGILSVASLANAGVNSPLGNYPTAGAGGLTLVGGALRYTGGGTSINRGLSFSGNSTLDVNANGTALTLGNCESVDIPGTFTVTGGAGSSLALGQVRIVEGAGITLNPTSVSVAVASVNGYTSYPNNSDVNLGGTAIGNTITGNVGVTNPPGSPYIQPIRVTKSNSSVWAINGVASSVSSLTVTGGTLQLNGINTYTGPTAVQGGTLVAGTNSPSNVIGAFGKATTEVNLGVDNGNNDAAILTGGPYTIGRIIRLLTQNTTDTGTRVLTLGGNTAHNSVFSGSVFLGTNSQAGRGVTLTAASAGQVTFSGVIQNPASMDATAYTVTKSGAGSVVLGNSNTYTGGTFISEGTLEITGATQATNSITFNSGGKLGLFIGSPVTATNAAVDFSNGTVAVTGTPSAASHTLLTALSITGTPVLAAPIPGYLLVIVGNQLQLNETAVSDPYTDWSGGAPFGGDANGDGVMNGIAWALGAANPAANATGLLPVIDGTGNADYFIFTYRRADAANGDPDSSIKVEYGNSLAAWAAAVHDGTNIIITPSNDFYGANPGIDKVEVKIKKALAPNGKLFARLNVTTTP